MYGLKFVGFIIEHPALEKSSDLALHKMDGYYSSRCQLVLRWNPIVSNIDIMLPTKMYYTFKFLACMWFFFHIRFSDM